MAFSHSFSDDAVSFAIYDREIRRVPLLTVDEEKRLGRRARSGDRKAIHRLVECNLRFVMLLARRRTGTGVDILDLVQEGSLGLIRAAEKFDERRGFRSISYAAWWVRQMMAKCLCDTTRTIRLPAHTISRVSSVGRVHQELELLMPGQVTSEAIAVQLGITADEVDEALMVGATTISLTDTRFVGDDGDVFEALVVKPDDVSPADRAEQSILACDIRSALAWLPPDQERLLVARLGLTSGVPGSLASSGRRKGQSRERMRQQEERALNNLRFLVEIGEAGRLQQHAELRGIVDHGQIISLDQSERYRKHPWRRSAYGHRKKPIAISKKKPGNRRAS